MIPFIRNIFIQSIITNYIPVCASVSGDQLLAVSIIFRHGDRMPVRFYPNDPHKYSTIWNTTPGDLTNVGKKQMYELGEWLRQRYDGFISRKYKKEEIYVRSSDKDRCIVSAAANLAGLYPQLENDVWHPNISWQLIPIHTVPLKYDRMLYYLESCPKFKKILLEYLKPIEERNKELFEYLSKHTGTSVVSNDDALHIWDTLDVEERHNLTLPEWTREVYPGKLKQARDELFRGHTSNPEIKKLVVGAIFHNILTQFDAFSMQGTPNKGFEKLRMFSGHDTNIIVVLNALNKPVLDVPLAAALIFELRKNVSGNYVQLIYKTDGTEILEICGNGPECRYEDFVNILKPLSLSEDEHSTHCKVT